MRNAGENKLQQLAVSEDPGTCPKCHQPTGPYACRDVPLGWYCRQWGLTYDYSRMHTSGGDPERRAAEREPAVVEAADRVTMLEAAFAEADRGWEDALRKRAEADLAVRGDDGTFSPSYGWRASKQAKQAAKKVPALAEAVDRVTRARDRAGEALLDARKAYTAALDAAYRERGLPVQVANRPDPTHFVPVV